MHFLTVVALTAVAAIPAPAPDSAAGVNIARVINGRAVYRFEFTGKDHCFVLGDDGGIIPCNCNSNCLRRK